MKTVETKEEIISNLQLLEYYLCEGSDEEKEASHILLKKGHNFIAYTIENEMRFAPSRYIGYINNTLAKHKIAKKLKEIKGTETDLAITKLLEKPLPNDQLNAKFESYCESLGDKPDRVLRKFWKLDIKPSISETFHSIENFFREGDIVERMHRSRERNPTLISQAKKNFLSKYGHLYCEVCEFDFERTYGTKGKDFIEAHHTVPISTMKPGHATNVSEIAMLCSNCHRILHRKRPWPTISELKDIISHEKSK